MSQELLYTSAPRGLKSGTHGFCMVLCSEGMPGPLATALEGLSAYKPVYPVGDPLEARNPVTAMHVILPAIGRKQHVLSRVASFGLDYSGRPNKLAHHVVLDSRDLAAAGPAWLLTQPGVIKNDWSGDPKVAAANRRLPLGDAPPAPCRAWARATEDAGWGGVLAESLMKDPSRQAYLIIEPGFDPLPLFAESIALLPADRRWQATFSTYYATLPAGATCNWRCLMADSPLVHQSKRHVQALRLDLTKPLGKAPEGEWVELARTGRRAAAFTTSVAKVSVEPLPYSNVEAIGYGLAHPQLRGLKDGRPLPNRRNSEPKRTRIVVVTATAVLLAAVGAVVVFVNRKSPPFEKPNVEVLTNTSSSSTTPSSEETSTADVSNDQSDNPKADRPVDTATSQTTADSGKQIPQSAQIHNAADSAPGAQELPAPPQSMVTADITPKAKRTVQRLSVAGASTAVSVPSPIGLEHIARVRFLAPAALNAKLTKTDQGVNAPYRVTVASRGSTLDASELVQWYSIEYDASGNVVLHVENENRRAALDGCAIFLIDRSGDEFLVALDLKNTNEEQSPRSERSKSVNVQLPFSAKTPLPSFEATEFTYRVGATAFRFDQKYLKNSAHAAESRRLLSVKQSLQLYPVDVGQLLSEISEAALPQDPRLDQQPRVTLSLQDNGKVPSRLISIDLHVPEDIGGFLTAINGRLASELNILTRNEAPTIDPESFKGERKDQRKEFALPAPTPVPLTPIDVPIHPDIGTLEAMRDSLKKWIDRTSDRHKVLIGRQDIKAEVYHTYIAEVETLQSNLDRYLRLTEKAIQVRNDLSKAVLSSGSIEYSAFDPNDPTFEVKIPVFEAPSR